MISQGLPESVVCVNQPQIHEDEDRIERVGETQKALEGFIVFHDSNIKI